MQPTMQPSVYALDTTQSQNTTYDSKSDTWFFRFYGQIPWNY